MTTATTDYRETLFESKDINKIVGEPDFESLKRLYDQLKINAQCVPSTLGGGAHGHLGLVLSAVEYQLVTLQPFIRPLDPGPFQLPQGVNVTTEQIRLLKDEHRELREQYEKVLNVEAALKKIIHKTIAEDYLLEIRNPITKRLEGTIPTIMAKLFASYGNLTAKTLMEKQQALFTYNYDPTTPIDKVFNMAQDYQEYGNFHGTPQPVSMIITLVYEILRKTGEFQSALEKWNDKAPQDKTWTNFKIHFRQAACRFKEFAPDTAAQAGYTDQLVNDITTGVANMLQSAGEENNEHAQVFLNNMSAAVAQNQQSLPQLFDSMNQMNQSIANLQATVQYLNAARSPIPNNNNTAPPNQQPQQHAPPFNPPPFQQQPYCQPVSPMPFNPPPNMQQHQQQYQQYQQQQYQGGGRGRGNHSRGRGNRGNGGRGNSQRGKHFCWSHGMCAHPSAQCQTPLPGHQWLATIRNTMGSPHSNAAWYST